MSNEKFQTDSRMLRGKIEGVSGVAETLANSDSFRARNVELSSFVQDFDNESSKFSSGDHTSDNAVAGSARGGIKLLARMCVGYARHTGATLDSQELEYSDWIEGCGLVKTVIPPTDGSTDDGKWVFTPSVDADENTMTTELVEKQKSDYAMGFKFAGAMGTLTIGAEGTGKPITATMEFKGKVSTLNEYQTTGTVPKFEDDDYAVDAEKKLATTLLNTDVIFTPVSNAVEGSPKAFCIGSYTFDTGSTIVENTCQSDPFGILNNMITARKPMLTIDPDLQSLQDFDFWGDIRNGQEYKVEIVRKVGAVETFRLDIPRAQIMAPSLTDKDGTVNNKLTVRPLRPWGVDRETDYKITIGCKSYS